MTIAARFRLRRLCSLRRADRITSAARVLLASVFFTVVILFTGCTKQPIRLRVVTYNIHHGEGMDGKFDLERMGKELNIGSARALKSYLGKKAGSRRHGKVEFITWEERKAVMVRAWTLMDRYLEYLKRGRKPLPDKEFPIPDFSKPG